MPLLREREENMKEIELFHLTHCPYCVKARKAIEELKKEEPAFSGIPVKWIEETEERELAESRDYYYVPTLYYDGKKLYEAKPFDTYETIRRNIRTAFQQVLAEQA